MTDRMDHLENGYRGPNQDHPTLVEEFRTPQEVKKYIEKAKFDGFDAGFDAGYDTGVQDAFTDARVCAGCGRIAFETKLGYCGECVAGIVEVVIGYVLPWLVIGLIIWLKS